MKRDDDRHSVAGRSGTSSCLLAFAMLSVTALFLAAAVTADETVTAVGSVACYDGSLNASSPLEGARIELWDSDCDGSTICDDFMAAGYIAADGSFSITGTGGDPFGGRPDVYLRVVYNDDNGVRLTDELNGDRYVDTPEHDHNDVGSGTVDFGAITIGLDVGAGNASKCGVWQAARTAYREYLALFGATPPAGHYDVEYWSAIWSGTPWTNTDTTHWPIHYTSSAARHEFAHSVRHAADGDSNHFNWDVTRFRYARNHAVCDPNSNRIGTDTHEMGLAFGFNEGWAEFWEGRTGGCWAVTIDDESEGNNAFALNVLAGQGGLGKKGLVDVLLSHPGAIHSLDEFIDFLAPAVSSTSSALHQSIQTAERPTSPAANRPGIGMRAQVGAVKKLIAQGSGQIASERRALEKAVAEAARPAPCEVIHCEVAFQRAIAPSILRAEIAVQSLELARLRSSIAPAYQEELKRAMVSGTSDRLLLESRSKDRARVIEATLSGLRAALRDGRAFVERAPQASPLLQHLEERAAKLQRDLSDSKNLPPGVSQRLAFDEDRAAPSR